MQNETPVNYAYSNIEFFGHAKILQRIQIAQYDSRVLGKNNNRCLEKEIFYQRIYRRLKVIGVIFPINVHLNNNFRV